MNCANHLDRERVAFCQNCGKPLCSECTRTIGSAVFCEQCLAARLAAADATANAQGTPYGSVHVPPANVPLIPGAPNPYLAGALGFIPGVGAMYNGQYAKGIVHLVVFAILVSLTDSSGIFGLFIAGWVVYQAIEAYHTARARRDGTPLPNPFGLNDIGDKFGFGRSWPAGTKADPSQSYPHSTAAPFSPPSGPGYTAPPEPPPSSWSPTPSSYTYGPPPTQPYTQPFSPVSSVVHEEGLASDRNRFPVGAIILIGLGVLFFIGSSGAFHHFPIQRIIPFFLIAFGVWLFVHKMTNTGGGLSDDGEPGYRLRLFRALRGSVWVTLVGVLFFLDTFDILSWGHSWPLFIIVAGLMTVFERSAYSAAANAAPLYPNYAPTSAPGPIPPQTAATSIVPVPTRDEEGR